MKLTAEQAIEKIESTKSTFMHLKNVPVYTYPIQVREQLQKMAERNEITPKEYWCALNITWPKMSDAEKKCESANNAWV